MECETLPLGELVDVVKRFLGKSAPTLAIPLPQLTAAAGVVQALTAGKSSIHPARVRKVATSTHIVPQFLTEAGFEVRYDFEASLKHWSSVSPKDFG